MDSLENGKVFVYKNYLNEYLFLEQRKVTENGINYILTESYDEKQRSSSDKFRVTDDKIELIETYIYDYPDSLSKDFKKDKANILETRNLNEGLKYRGYTLTLTILIGGNFKGKMTTKETFIREDKLQLKGKEFDVIVFTNDIDVKAWHRFVPFVSSQTIYTGEKYYARGLGLVKYTTKSEAEESEWTLDEIKSLKSD